MRLRTKLVLAFVLLSVVPLLGATVYSYLASIRAFRRAVAAEAGSMAMEMSRRMDTVTAELGQRLAQVQELPLAGLEADPGSPEGAGREQLLEDVRAAMGDAAELVESLQFMPLPPAPPAAPGAQAPPAPAQKGPGAIMVMPERPGPRGRGPRRWVFRRAAPPAPEADGEPAASAAGEAADALSRADQREEWKEARREMARAQREMGRARMEAAQALQESMAARMRHTRVPGPEDIHLTLRRGGEAVGTMKARVRSEALLRSVLSPAARRPDEVPFALDAEGRLYAADPAQEARLKELGVAPAASAVPAVQAREDWVVVSRKDPGSGLTLGIARPVGEGLKEIRRTAVRNLGLGVAIVGLALVGVAVISGRMTRNLDELARGAELLGQGQLEARVPVRSRDEIGRLAETFNRMARELRSHQDQLLEQERLRKELEMCRRIQEEMLPQDPLRVPFAEVKGISLPAREVGGDFFNYFVMPGGETALLVGDVSGKGVPAALLMANAQATLRARLPVEPGLAPLAETLDHELAGGAPAYLTLFLAVLDGAGRRLRYVNAGHNPPLLLHADGRVEALPATGRPLGLYPGGGYEERSVPLGPGATLFLYTDGLVEAEDESGEAFGLERLQALLLSERENGPDAILVVVEEAVRTHRGRTEAADDATLVALRIAPSRGA